MKRNRSASRSRALGRYILCGGIMAVILSVPLPVRAQVPQKTDAKSTMKVMLAAQDTSDTELQTNQIPQIEDSTELDAEFSELEDMSVMIVEEVERQREEARRSKIWGTVIIVLVLSVFGVGIVSAVKGNKAENTEKTENTENTEKTENTENTETELQKKKNHWWEKQKENQTENQTENQIEDIEIEEISE